MAGRKKASRARKKPSPPRAPATEEPSFEGWKSDLTPRELRVDEIVQMMAQGQWMAGVSHRQLAEKWGVTPGTVEHIACEANRQLRTVFRRDEESLKDLRAMVLQTFEVIRVRGLLARSPGGLRVALEANEALGRYLGIEPPKKLSIREGGEFDNMTDAELRAIVAGGGDGDRSGG